jgi:hypothetical protein
MHTFFKAKNLITTFILIILLSGCNEKKPSTSTNIKILWVTENAQNFNNETAFKESIKKNFSIYKNSLMNVNLYFTVELLKNKGELPVVIIDSSKEVVKAKAKAKQNFTQKIVNKAPSIEAQNNEFNELLKSYDYTELLAKNKLGGLPDKLITSTGANLVAVVNEGQVLAIKKFIDQKIEIIKYNDKIDFRESIANYIIEKQKKKLKVEDLKFIYLDGISEIVVPVPVPPKPVVPVPPKPVVPVPPKPVVPVPPKPVVPVPPKPVVPVASESMESNDACSKNSTIRHGQCEDIRPSLINIRPINQK